MGIMKKHDKSDEVSLKEYLDAKEELERLQQEHGIAPKEKGLSRLVSAYFNRQENRPKKKVSRKRLLLLAVFTGWMGGHRFYAGHYIVAVTYLLLFWTGIPIAMTLIDLLQFIPYPPDEDGNILV